MAEQTRSFTDRRVGTWVLLVGVALLLSVAPDGAAPAGPVAELASALGPARTMSRGCRSRPVTGAALVGVRRCRIRDRARTAGRRMGRSRTHAAKSSASAAPTP